MPIHSYTFAATLPVGAALGPAFLYRSRSWSTTMAALSSSSSVSGKFKSYRIIDFLEPSPKVLDRHKSNRFMSLPPTQP